MPTITILTGPNAGQTISLPIEPAGPSRIILPHPTSTAATPVISLYDGNHATATFTFNKTHAPK